MQEKTKSVIEISKKQIEQNLLQLNLTIEPRLVISRRHWFFKNKIKIFTFNTRTYLEPKNVSSKEIIEKINKLNFVYNELKVLIILCKDEQTPVSFKNGKYVSTNKKIQKINEKLDSIKLLLHWFLEKNLKVKKTKVSVLSFYEFEGEG